MSDAFVYLITALIGAIAGGIASFLVAARGAARDRRTRYGEALLDTLSALHTEVVLAARPIRNPELGAHSEAPDLSPVLSRQLTAMWVRAELVGAAQTWRKDRVAVQAWVEDLVDAAIPTTQPGVDVNDLEERLEAAVYVVIAWTAGQARGRDFRLPRERIYREYGPPHRRSGIPMAEPSP